jgi:hypothetical protein
MSSYATALPLLELPGNCVRWGIVETRAKSLQGHSLLRRRLISVLLTQADLGLLLRAHARRGACSCVFSHLNLQEALRLSWACKPLHALSEAATCRRVACAKCKTPVFNPAVVLATKDGSGGPVLELQDGDCYAADPDQLLPGAVLSEEHSTDDISLHFNLVVSQILGPPPNAALCMAWEPLFSSSHSHNTSGASHALLGSRCTHMHTRLVGGFSLASNAGACLPAMQRTLNHVGWELDDELKVQSISCLGCGLYLGLRLMQYGKHKLGECE